MAEREFSTRGGVSYVHLRNTWGSGFVSHKSATWPFARLTIGDEQILISSIFGKVHVTAGNLVSISGFGRVPVLASGFKFTTDNRDDAVVFWAVRANQVRHELRCHGWETGRRKRYKPKR